MNIRVVTKNDVNDICKLVMSLSHYYLKDKEGELPEWFAATLTRTAFLKRIENIEFSNFLYESQGSIIGYIAMKGNSHLYHLFVAEKEQGKGIARKLWQYAIGYCVSDMYTLRSSLYAVPIYKKLGFVESDTVQEKEGIGFQPMELKQINKKRNSEV